MKTLIVFVLMLFSFNGFSYLYEETVVIKDSIGTPLTRCTGLSCTPTIHGMSEGFDYGDMNFGGSFMPSIDHMDGSTTECFGVFCERKRSRY